VGQGCKEVTLIGQTVNSYRFRHGDGRTTRLSDLIARMHNVPGLERIKFVTNFPKDMGDDLLDAVRELPKVVKYLHVPVQSGCDEVLRRMKRLYTVESYRELLVRCREKIPGVAISSDFIVGFCGETDVSFAKTMELVRESKFKNSFIFKYSERPGTKAADRYPDDIPEDVKKRRNNDLLAVQNANSLADHRAKIGETVEVLVEGPSKRDAKLARGEASQLVGRSMTDHIVVFDGPERLVGHTVRVAIDDASSFTLYGRAETTEVAGTCGAAAPQAASRFTLPLV
ncbi:MAG TPA: radical SAM protein, partial [Gemmataceae bacterium]|nr:radical SAM protein [Gemmataceae bacterium]